MAVSVVRMRRRAAELRKEAKPDTEEFRAELLSAATVIANAADRAARQFTPEQLLDAAAELDAEPDEEEEEELP